MLLYSGSYFDIFSHVNAVFDINSYPIDPESKVDGLIEDEPASDEILNPT